MSENGNIAVTPAIEQPIDVTIVQELSENIIEVLWMDEAGIDIQTDIQYISAGREEIENYVNSVSKPSIEDFIGIKKGEISDFVLNETSDVKDDIEAFANEVIKPELESYAGGLKPALQGYVEDAAGFADSAERSATQAGMSASSASEAAIAAFEQADRAESEAERAGGYAASINPEKFADKDLVNTGMITNCILEAPNGVLVMDPYVGSVSRIGVQAGVKVAYPVGRDESGKAKSDIKNHDRYSIVQLQLGNNKRIYIYSAYLNEPEGVGGQVNERIFIDDVLQDNYVVSTKIPSSTNNIIWFNPEDNMHYTYRGITPPLYQDVAWRPISLSVLGVAQTDAAGKVVNLKAYHPTNLLKTSDISTIIEAVFPNSFSSINNVFSKNVTTTPQFFTAPANGWVRVWGSGSVSAVLGCDYTDTDIGTGQGAVKSSVIQIRKGQQVFLRASSGVTTIGGSSFTYAFGESI